VNAINEWEACYQASVFELDNAKPRAKIRETRYAIEQRLVQDIGTKERRDIENAQKVLVVLEGILDRHRPAA
jgi:hypothetical protein